MKYFEILGIEPTKDKKVIRHAYATAAKKYHLETDTEEIERLKEAYDCAIEYTKAGREIFSVEEKRNFIHDMNSFIHSENKPLDYEISDNQEEEENLFFQSKSLWENYEKIEFEKAKKLPGIQKIKKDIEEGHIFSFVEGKNYVISKEFLDNQFEEFYINALLEVFQKYEEKIFHDNNVITKKKKQVLEEFILPFAFLYGWTKDEDSMYLQFRPIDVIQDFLEEHFYELEESKLLQKEEIIAFSINAHSYYALAMAYKNEMDVEKQNFFWKNIWQYGLDYEVLPIVKVKNDFSFWLMLTIFLEKQKKLNFTVYQNLEQTFHLYTRKNSSQKHIFQPIIDRIEKNTSPFMYLITARNNQIVELRKKSNFSKYLEEKRLEGLDYHTFVYFYELYYYVPEPTEEEQRVMELLQEYTEYEKHYWEQVEQKFEEELEIDIM